MFLNTDFGVVDMVANKQMVLFSDMSLEVT